MTDTSTDADGCAGRPPRQHGRADGAARRAAELEAEVAALRRALARAGLDTERATGRHGEEPAAERAGRAADAALNAARHGREMAVGRADLAAAEGANEALRRANAELAASRAALRGSEERLRLLLDSAADHAIVGMDLDRRVTSWNAGAERLTGWTEAEAVGRLADLIFTPEDRAAGAPQREAAEALRDGRAADERWHLRKDGSRFWGSGLMLPLRDPAADPAGAAPVGLLKVMRDETARRRAEERLAALVELGDRLRGLRDPGDILHAAAEVAGSTLGCDRAGFGVVDAAEETNTVARFWSSGRRSAPLQPGAHPLRRYWDGYAEALRRGEAVAVADTETDPRTAPNADAYAAAGVRAAVHVPVAQAGRVAAILCVHAAAPRRWDAEEVAFLRGAAARAWASAERARAEEALRRVEARQTFLLRLADALRPLQDPEEMQAEACRLLGLHLGVAGVGFGRIDAAQERVTIRRDWNDGRVHSVVGTWRMDDFGPAFIAAMKRGESAAIPDVAVDPRTDAPEVVAAYAGIGVRAVLHVPLVKNGRLAAMLFVHHQEPRRWTPAEAEVVRETCERLWDAVERAHAEEALRDSEARWRGLFENMHEGFVLGELVRGAGGRAADWRFLDVNPAWGRLTGVPPGAAPGRTVREVFPGIEDAWIDAMAAVAETGAPAAFTRRVGALGRWYEGHAFAAGGDRFAVLFLDVTGRKAAEARRDALVELGDRLRDLRGPGEIAHTAAEVIGRALGASRAGYGAVDREETHRIERDWTAGPEVASVAGEWRLSEYWTGFADDLRRGEAVVVRDTARDPRSAGAADAYAAVGVRAQVVVPVVEAGRVAALLFVHDAAPRDWTGEEVAFVRGAADRAWAAAERVRAEAALRESEGRRRAALDAARLGTFEWDLATEAVALDGRAREIFGFAPGEGGTAGEVFGRVHPGDLPRVRAAVAAAVAACARLEADYRIVLPGGAVRAVGSVGDFRAGADGRAARMAGVFADTTERQRAEDRRALLVRELNHRVKNTLAVVQSLALQTARGAADLPAFSKAFQARLVALARAHDLLTRGHWEGAAIEAVVRAASEPLLPGGGARLDLSGCAPAGALLPPGQALALSLALHELATNALKHGALSVPGGRVAVACRADPAAGGAWTVEWEERGGPPVAGPPARRGFGLRLLERGLASQAGLRADLRFEPEGVRCVLRLPTPVTAAAAADGGGSGESPLG